MPLVFQYYDFEQSYSSNYFIIFYNVYYGIIYKNIITEFIEGNEILLETKTLKEYCNETEYPFEVIIVIYFLPISMKLK